MNYFLQKGFAINKYRYFLEETLRQKYCFFFCERGIRSLFGYLSELTSALTMALSLGLVLTIGSNKISLAH